MNRIRHPVTVCSSWLRGTRLVAFPWSAPALCCPRATKCSPQCSQVVRAAFCPWPQRGQRRTPTCSASAASSSASQRAQERAVARFRCPHAGQATWPVGDPTWGGSVAGGPAAAGGAAGRPRTVGGVVMMDLGGAGAGVSRAGACAGGWAAGGEGGGAAEGRLGGGAVAGAGAAGPAWPAGARDMSRLHCWQIVTSSDRGFSVPQKGQVTVVPIAPPSSADRVGGCSRNGSLTRFAVRGRSPSLARAHSGPAGGAITPGSADRTSSGPCRSRSPRTAAASPSGPNHRCR